MRQRAQARDYVSGIYVLLTPVQSLPVRLQLISSSYPAMAYGLRPIRRTSMTSVMGFRALTLSHRPVPAFLG